MSPKLNPLLLFAGFSFLLSLSLFLYSFSSYWSSFAKLKELNPVLDRNVFLDKRRGRRKYEGRGDQEDSLKTGERFALQIQKISDRPRLFRLPKILSHQESSQLLERSLESNQLRNFPVSIVSFLIPNIFSKLSSFLHIPETHGESLEFLFIPSSGLAEQSFWITPDDPTGPLAGQRLATTFWCLGDGDQSNITSILFVPELEMSQNLPCHRGDIFVLFNVLGNNQPDNYAKVGFQPIAGAPLAHLKPAIAIQHYRQVSIPENK